jgi:hypothetical protein
VGVGVSEDVGDGLSDGVDVSDGVGVAFAVAGVTEVVGTAPPPLPPPQATSAQEAMKTNGRRGYIPNDS